MTNENELTLYRLQFRSGDMDPEDLHLRGFTGIERLGQLYEYRLFLERGVGLLSEEELDDLLLAPCSFTLGPEETDVIHGIVQHIELTEAIETKRPQYVATVVPTCWLLTLSKVSRVFQDMSVVEIVSELLRKYSLSSGEHFEFRLNPSTSKSINGPGAKREFCVQYEESDWSFIQRWLEYEGLYFWFEHHEQGEKLILGDGKPGPIPGQFTLSYNEWNDVSWPMDTVSRWRMSQRRIPARVVLKDYNYRNPSIPLVAGVPIDTQRGFGTVFSYGEHFRDEPSGKILAERRADRYRATRQVFAGATDCYRCRVGHTFELLNHFEPSFNRKYLITQIEYRMGFTGSTNPKDNAHSFLASFEAIPSDVPFRPEQTVPWPSIHGVMHAHIDSDSSGKYATLDEMGRYRVRLPFDSSGKAGEKVSPGVRMAQPYVGAGYGTHFPLHKGAEVLLGFLDGNPDRPIILGAVPNPTTSSPTDRANATQSVIATASGIRIEMEDSK